MADFYKEVCLNSTLPFDVHILSPEKTDAQKMKTRLAVLPGLNVSDVQNAAAIKNISTPKQGALFVYWLTLVSEIAALSELTKAIADLKNPSVRTVFICRLKSENLRPFIEGFPQAVFISAEQSAEGVDHIVLKLVEKLRTSSQTGVGGLIETLVYSKEHDAFIARGYGDLSKDKASPQRPQPAEEKAKKESLFQEVTLPEQKDLMLQDAVDSHAPVLLSTYDTPDELRGLVSGFSQNRERLVCNLDGGADKVAQFKGVTKGEKKIAISLALKQSRVFFACSEFHWTNETNIEIPLPSLVYFVQRRKDFRLQCYPQGQQVLFFNLPPSNYFLEVYDLSAGGISLLCGKDDFAALKSLDTVTSAQFQIEGQTVSIEVMRRRQANPFKLPSGADVFRLGYSFEAIDPAALKIITTYVDREARTYFQTYVATKN